jgi:hypothetical protein
VAEILKAIADNTPWIVLGVAIYLTIASFGGRRSRKRSSSRVDFSEEALRERAWAEHISAHAESQRGAVTLVPPSAYVPPDVPCRLSGAARQ